MNTLLSQLVAAEAVASDRRVIVLAGVTGDGKSSTGNTLVGAPVFDVSGGLCSATQECSHADFMDGEMATRVVDTVGFCDTSLTHEATLERFRSFGARAPCGIDCFLFVVRWGRFKPEHEAALSSFSRNVSDAALPHTLLCFTHCSLDAAALNAALDSGAPPALRALLGRVGVVVGVDNNAGGSAGQLSLHAAVERVRAGRGGDRFSNVALDEAQAMHAAADEEERAAFAAAVSDWRKGTGPVLVEGYRGAAAAAVAVL
jgi:hypothetical protein